MIFMFDLTNSHDHFDNLIYLNAKERGEMSDYINFNTRPLRLGFGKYHTVNIHVSRFTETDRYKNIRDNQKPCSSNWKYGLKRYASME